MSFTWRFHGADGGVLSGPHAPVAPAHSSQSDAESWLGEEWRELASRGVSGASLLHDDEVVYGPLPLTDTPA